MAAFRKRVHVKRALDSCTGGCELNAVVWPLIGTNQRHTCTTAVMRAVPRAVSWSIAAPLSRSWHTHSASPSRQAALSGKFPPGVHWSIICLASVSKSSLMIPAKAVQLQVARQSWHQLSAQHTQTSSRSLSTQTSSFWYATPQSLMVWAGTGQI